MHFSKLLDFHKKEPVSFKDGVSRRMNYGSPSVMGGEISSGEGSADDYEIEASSRCVQKRNPGFSPGRDIYFDENKKIMHYDLYGAKRVNRVENPITII